MNDRFFIMPHSNNVTFEEKLTDIKQNFIVPRGKESREEVASIIVKMLETKSCSWISCSKCPMANKGSKNKRWRSSYGCYSQIGFDFRSEYRYRENSIFEEMANSLIDWAYSGFKELKRREIGFDFE